MNKGDRIDSVKPITRRELNLFFLFLWCVLSGVCFAGVALWPSIKDSLFIKRDSGTFIDWPAVYERRREEQEQLYMKTLDARVRMRATASAQARRRNEQTITVILEKR